MVSTANWCTQTSSSSEVSDKVGFLHSTGSYGKVSLVKIKGQSLPIPGFNSPPLKEFAVKEIEKDLILKYKIDKQVLNEIRIMYTLDHDNIIKLYNHFEDDKKCYLIMEYAYGVGENDDLGTTVRQTQETRPTRRKDHRVAYRSTLQNSAVFALSEDHPQRHQA